MRPAPRCRRAGGLRPCLLALALFAPLASMGCDIVEPDGADAAADLERARERWDAAKIRDYTLTIERLCLCPLVGPVDVLVQGGVAIAAVPESGSVVGVSLEDYPAVDGLFEFVEGALRRRVHRLTVVYHPTLGYPTEIDVDYDEFVDDEEVRIHASLELATGVVPGR